MRKLASLLLVLVCSIQGYSQQQMVLESVNQKDIDYVITLDSIVKFYEEIAHQHTSFGFIRFYRLEHSHHQHLQRGTHL
jgi:hypothetical protein